MRSRLVALGVAALVVVAGCSRGQNLDLVLSPNSPSPTIAGANPDVTRPTNAEGVVIDRSSLATTPAGPIATSPVGSTTSVAAGTPTTSVAGNSTASTTSVAPTADDPATGDTSGASDTSGAVPTSSLAPSQSIKWLWASLADLGTAWNRGQSTIAGSPFQPLDAASIATGPMSIGGQGFAVRSVIPGGVLGGTVENDRDVSSILLIIPGDLDLNAAIQSVWVMLDGTPGAVPIFDGMQAFSEFTASGLPPEGTQRWLDPSGDDYSVVLTVVSGSLIGSSTDALEVAVVPVADQGLAQSMAQPLRVEILSLLG